MPTTNACPHLHNRARSDDMLPGAVVHVRLGDQCGAFMVLQQSSSPLLLSRGWEAMELAPEKFVPLKGRPAGDGFTGATVVIEEQRLYMLHLVAPTQREN